MGNVHALQVLPNAFAPGEQELTAWGDDAAGEAVGQHGNQSCQRRGANYREISEIDHEPPHALELGERREGDKEPRDILELELASDGDGNVVGHDAPAARRTE